MSFTIRHEAPGDYHAVEGLVRDAFWRFWEPDGRVIADEHLLAHRLRDAPSFVPELDFVAVGDDGELIGRIMYTRAEVVVASGESTEILTFGPLAVRPDMQGKGVGQALIAYSAARARDLGFPAIVIWGPPDYYPRAGFERAAAYGLADPSGLAMDAMMVLPLRPGALEGVAGMVRIDRGHFDLDPADVAAFDALFPARPPHQTTSVDVLAPKIGSAAVVVLEENGVPTVDSLRARSEAEIRRLPGFDDDDKIAALKAAVQSTGHGWGE